MEALLLAAGRGARLDAHALGRPKPLVHVAGRPLIAFALESLARAGIRDVYIAVGYKRSALMAGIGDGAKYGVSITYVHNSWWRYGNATSLWAAREHVRSGPFLLCMADHVVSPDLLRRVLSRPVPPGLLAVDFSPSEREVMEGTRVQTGEDGVIQALGKGLVAWQGIDTGIFMLDPSVFAAMDGFMQQSRKQYNLSDALTYAMDGGYPLHSCDVSGYFWQDVDTPEDIAFLTARLEADQVG